MSDLLQSEKTGAIAVRHQIGRIRRLRMQIDEQDAAMKRLQPARLCLNGLMVQVIYLQGIAVCGRLAPGAVHIKVDAVQAVDDKCRMASLNAGVAGSDVARKKGAVHISVEREIRSALSFR